MESDFPTSDEGSIETPEAVFSKLSTLNFVYGKGCIEHRVERASEQGLSLFNYDVQCGCSMFDVQRARCSSAVDRTQQSGMSRQAVYSIIKLV